MAASTRITAPVTGREMSAAAPAMSAAAPAMSAAAMSAAAVSTSDACLDQARQRDGY